MNRNVDTAIEVYVCEKIFGKFLAPEDIRENIKNISPAQLAVKVANAMVGIHEDTENNCGVLVESIQRTVGKAEKEAWCMSLQQTIEAIVEKWKGVKSSLPVGEHCLTVYGLSKKIVSEPKLNDIAIWRKAKTTEGHTGRVVVEGDSTFTSLEGNTGDGTGINREGDGVYLKHRDVKGSGKLALIGFIRVEYV